MVKTACGCSNTWSQLHLEMTDPNMSTYIMWDTSGPCWQLVSNTKNLVKAYPSSALLNLNLSGGNMHPEEFQAKEKVINPSRSDKDTDVNM